MIPKVKELKLVSIYLYICDIYDSKLRSARERFSNNNLSLLNERRTAIKDKANTRIRKRPSSFLVPIIAIL